MDHAPSPHFFRALLERPKAAGALLREQLPPAIAEQRVGDPSRARSRTQSRGARRATASIRFSVTNGHGTLADMKVTVNDPLVQRCLASIRAISPAITVEFSLPSASKRKQGPFDGELRVKLARPRGHHHYLVQAKRTHLSYALVDGLLGRLREVEMPWVLFAPNIATPMGRYLAERQVSYVDAIGNLHLLGAGGRDLLVHVEGKTPRREVSGRGMRLPAHLVSFALLARRSLRQESIRAIAQATGVSKSAVADHLQRLSEQGFLVKTREGPSLLRTGELLDRWVSAYLDVVRPRWFRGRFHAQAADVDALERQIQIGLSGLTWALGGGAAAWRMTHYHRGEETIVHVAGAPQDLAARLRALPSDDGNLVILDSLMPLAFEGVEPHLAHPLLVYAEMLTSRDPRTRGAAEAIRRQFLPELE